MISRLLNRFPYVFWSIGILLPVLYLSFFSEIKRTLKASFEDKWMKFLSLFIIIQLFSLFLSVFQDYFTLSRGIASLHNVVSYSFIFLGYVLMQQEKFRSYFSRYIGEIFMIFGALIALSFVYSVLTESQLIYPGILSWISENKFTEVRLNRPESAFFGYFPRSTFMGIFPNSTAFIAMILHSLFMAINGDSMSFWKRNIFFIALILIMLLTGSRVFLLMALFLYGISFIRHKRDLTFIVFASPLILYGVYEIVEYLSSLREGSNVTRSILIQNSLDYYWKTNPVFGLGIKPINEEILGGLPYPIGSHSTLTGTFVKSGLLGGLLLVIFYLFLMGKWIKILFQNLFTSIKFEPGLFYVSMSVIMVIFASVFEDIDAYELVPLYLGMLLFLFKEKLNLNGL